MNDPHVEELIYRIKTEDGFTFLDPPPIEHETEAFRMTLEDGIVTFSMKENHPTEDSARQAVAEYLRSWEIDGALHTPVELSGRAVAPSSATANLVVPKTEYSQPPRDFVADTDTEVLWKLYEGYKEGRDRL